MRYTVNKAKPKEIEFPCLMTSGNGEVWLLTNKDEGTCVSSMCAMSVGYHSKQIDLSDFEYFEGSVTLEN